MCDVIVPAMVPKQGWKIRWTSAGITYNTYYIVLSYNTQAYYVRGPPPLGNQMYPMLSQDILGYCSVYLRILRDMLVRGQDQMLSSVAFKVGRAVLCISAEGPAGIMYNTYYIILNIYYVFCIFHPCMERCATMEITWMWLITFRMRARTVSI